MNYALESNRHCYNEFIIMMNIKNILVISLIKFYLNDVTILHVHNDACT